MSVFKRSGQCKVSERGVCKGDIIRENKRILKIRSLDSMKLIASS